MVRKKIKWKRSTQKPNYVPTKDQINKGKKGIRDNNNAYMKTVNNKIVGSHVCKTPECPILTSEDRDYCDFCQSDITAYRIIGSSDRPATDL